MIRKIDWGSMIDHMSKDILNNSEDPFKTGITVTITNSKTLKNIIRSNKISKLFNIT